jgi:hypothetical protein
MHSGLGTACAQKKLEPTHVRLLREIWSLRSIECEFDHLFLVEACSTIRHDLPGSQIAKERFARRNALGPGRGLRAEKI